MVFKPKKSAGACSQNVMGSEIKKLARTTHIFIESSINACKAANNVFLDFCKTFGVSFDGSRSFTNAGSQL